MNTNLSKGRPVSLIRITALIIIIAGAIYAKEIIAPFLIALFISIISAQPIFWLEKKKVPRVLAVIIVLIGILAIFFGIGYLIGNELTSFTKNAPNYETRLKAIMDSFINFLNSNGFDVTRDQFPDLLDPTQIFHFTVKAVNELAKIVGSAFLVFLTVLFMLLELSSISDKVKVVFTGPAESYDYIKKIIDSIRRYLAIKTILSIVTGVVLYIFLSLIGLKYAILWALIAGLMSYVPHIGSIIAAIPALLFALIQSGPGGAIWTLISFLVVNNILNNFIEPKIMGRGLSLSTLVVFISLIFWGFVLGTVGMFLSVPLTTTIKIVLEQNEKTRWIAILLGTHKDAKDHLAAKKFT
jgi:predicted PurR-regulated permease PerM